MRKIQNTRPPPQPRARWGAVRQESAPRPSRFGSVQAVLASQWVAPNAPSLTVQADAAARQRRLIDYTEDQHAQLQAAFAVMAEGKGTPSEPPFLAEALSSGVLRSELSEIATRLREAALAQQPDERTELSERDYVLLHLRPSPVQGKLPEELSKLLAACTTHSAQPCDQVAARRATHKLNEYILAQVQSSSGSEEGGTQPVLSLKAVLGDNCSILSDDNSLCDETMRCRCLLSALKTSGLLQPDQMNKKVLLPCGMALDVIRQQDAWRQVEVVMSGLSSDIPMAEASFYVTKLLEGSNAEFELSALSACSQSQHAEGALLSGRELLGIKLIPPSQAVPSGAHSSMQPSERSLILRVRRDVVPLLPPAFSVLMVRPHAPAASARSVLTWVRLHVDAKDGHTDTNRCDACGDAGHAAATCLAARDGHSARFQCFATVPPVAAAVSGGSGQQQPNLSHAGSGKQQQAQQQKQQQAGFITVTGSRRATNQQLNQQATSTSASATGATSTPSPPTAVNAIAAAQPVVTTSAQHQTVEAPTDPSVVAESEHLEQLNQLERGLQRDHELLAACLNEDDAVASDQSQQFGELQLAHSARRAELAAVSTDACEAVAVLTAALASCRAPKGKGKKKAGKVSKENYELKLKTFQELQGQRKTQLTTAQCKQTGLQALTSQYEAFAARLQQYNSATLLLSNAQLSLEVQSTVPQLTTDSCESPLSPIIAIHNDSQGTPAAVAAAALEVGPAVTAAVASLRADAHTSPDAQHLQVNSTQLEQQRNEQFAARLDPFDAAEQIATDAEQRRLLLNARSSETGAQSSAVSSSAVQPDTADTSAVQPSAAADSGAVQPETADSSAVQPSAAVHSSTAVGSTDTPDTDEDSSSSTGGSGSSESSESECSDANSARNSQRAAAKKQQQQQQQQVAVTAGRAVTRALSRSASLPTSN